MEKKQKPFFWQNWKYNAIWAFFWFLLLLWTSANLIYLGLDYGLQNKIPSILFVVWVYFSVILILLDALAVVFFTLRTIINYQKRH